jgi:hypothetical protein
MEMSTLLVIAAVLVAVWLAALIVFKVAGFAIHLLLLVGLVLLAVGLFRRGARAVRRRM